MLALRSAEYQAIKVVHRFFCNSGCYSKTVALIFVLQFLYNVIYSSFVKWLHKVSLMVEKYGSDGQHGLVCCNVILLACMSDITVQM